MVKPIIEGRTDLRVVLVLKLLLWSTTSQTTETVPTATTSSPTTPKTETSTTLEPTTYGTTIAALESTTLEPTTHEVTSPTALEPTTQAELTAEYSTAENPTTEYPTTLEPTTQPELTTEYSTTENPTTEFPTTLEPTTQVELTTEYSTTENPTTEFPTTLEPTTQPELTTEYSTTENPTTEFPTTLEPTTQVELTTEYSTTENPTTEFPTTLEPTTTSVPTTTATPTLPWTEPAERAPTGPPRNVSGDVIEFDSSVSSVLLTWEPPPFSDVNGILIGYTIYYQRIDETDASVLYVNETEYTLLVEPFEDYNITIAARTSAGEGPKGPSPPLKINSAKGLPDVPVNVTAMTNGLFALLVSWKPPMKPNGVIVGYRVLACDLELCHSNVTDGTTTFVIFEELRAFTLYHVFVFARTSAGEGSSSCSSAYTEQTAPSAPPQNVSVLVLNSTSLYVSWDLPPVSHRNGIIVYYTVAYATGMTNRSQLLPGGMLSLTLTGLNEFTRYDVSVSAFTVAIGPESSPISVITEEDAPSQPPTNLTVTPIDPCFNYWENCGLSKLQVKWDPPPAEDRNGIIILYEIYYIGAEFDTELHTANVSGSVQSLTLTGLEEYVIYDVRIRAFTHVGPSSFSLDQSVRTYAAAPASPLVLSIQNVSSNSNIDGLTGLKVTWSLSPRNVNGLFVGIDLSYYCSSAGYYNVFGPEGYAQRMCGCDYHNEMHFLKNETEFVITDLTSYSWYDIYVRTVSQVEPGGRQYRSDWNPNIVLTAEDRPTGVPRNLSVVETIGRKELLISWIELLCTLINGMLEKYVIYYQRESGPAVPSDVQNVTASPSSTSYTLSNLESFGMYSVWMQAFTGAGGGPLTPIVRARVCGCYLPGSVGENCNLTTGQCLCRYGAEGQNCDTCILSQKPFANISECLVPQNVTATVLSSIAILVEWSPLNDFSVSGYNIYYRADGESLRRRYDVDDVAAHNATLTGLRPFTNYTITMDAVTEEGLSPEGPDPPLRVRTEEDVPKAPRLSSVSRYRDGWSPAYLIVSWETLSVTDQNGVITAYEINYVGDEFDTDPHSVNVSGSVTSLTLSGLEEYVVYDVKIRAYTSVGPGPFSAILSARTYGARPASPVILSIQNVSSISSIDGLAGLKVTWSNPPPRDVNGLFLETRIDYWCSSYYYFSYAEGTDQMMCDCYYHYSETVFLKNETEFVITNLTSYSWYDVYFFAVSQDGPGGRTYQSDWNPNIVLTAEDRPTGVPRNFSVVGTIGRKALLISWTELLCTLINGLLEKYVIYYQRESGPAAPSDVQNVTVSPSSTKYTLSNLESFGEYSVWMQAFTGAGGGPLTPVVRARTTGVCECYLPGSVSENCNLTTGQCLCRDGAEGQNCDTCILSEFASISECLVPEFPPQNITATVLSSTAVLVEWSSLNDFNVSGYNIYYRADGESLRRRYDVDDVDAHNATLTGLRPFTNYTITMDAATGEGLSPEGPDPPLRVRTEEDVPKAPRLLSVSRFRESWSPAYLIVRWETLSVADQNEAITAYEINYAGDEFDTDPHFFNVSGSVTSLTLSGLEEYVVYDVKIRAYTSVGPSPFSAILSARTYGARPASPVILSVQNVSSSSSIDGLAGLKVTWSNPSPRDVNGLFVGIRIAFHCSSNGYYTFFSSYEEGHIQMMCDCDYHYEMDFLKNGTEFVITNLTSYSWYDVFVHAISQDGPGGSRYQSDWNPNIVLTAEDRPTGVPRNLSVVGTVGRKELLISWIELLCTLINGLLEKYVIYYRRESEPAAPSDVQSVTVSPSSTNYTLSNLESFGEYSVWMQAFTGAGGGPLTPIVKARTTRVCECYLPGSVSENCDLTTGQCLCRDGADGQNCDTCILSQKPFSNITECLEIIDNTPFNCLDPPRGWPNQCNDVALPSRPPARLHVSATVLSGDSALRDHVSVYWNGWTCFFTCPLTYTWKVYILVRRDSFLVMPPRFSQSHRIDHQPVRYPIFIHPFSGMNLLELTVAHGSHTSIVRSLILVDTVEGSSVALSTRHKLQFTSAKYKNWQTDQRRQDLSVSWENHFYNTYIKKNPSLLFPIEQPQFGYDVVTPPLSFSGIQTFNYSGIMSFGLSLYQKNATYKRLIASQNFTALEQNWVYRHPKPFESGETYEVKMTAKDIFGHQAFSSALVYTDFTPPSIADVIVWKREQSPIRDLDLCSQGRIGSVFTLELRAMDKESGIETIEWTISKTKSSTTSEGRGTITSQIQSQCLDRDESCYCATDGVCVLKTFTSGLQGLETLLNSNRFYLSIRANSRSGLTSAPWEKENPLPRKAGISPTLERLTPARRTMRVEWSLGGSPTRFLVIACRKDLITEECVTCLEVSVDGSQREVEVENLEPVTNYRVQIEAFDGDNSGLSAANETKTQEDRPDGSPINIAVTTLPNKEALVVWKPPDLFEQNGKITNYEVAVEIEDSLGQWVLAQAEIATVAPQITVRNLFSGRNYRIRVSAATAIGFGPPSDPFDFTTPEDVPDEPPANVSLARATKSSVSISWEAIPSGSRNGVLRDYVVTYVAQKGGEAEKTVTVRGTETSATLSGLLPYTFYIVKVSGRTSKGLGPVSDDLTVRTREDIPGPPSVGRADPVSSTAISLSWTAPSEPRGEILDYRIFVFSSSNRRRRDLVSLVSVANFTVQRDKSNIIIRNLTEGTNYSIYMRARTSQGLGEKTALAHVVTLKQIPGAPRGLTAGSDAPERISVSWLAPSAGKISRYVIVYSADDEKGEKRNETTAHESYVLDRLSPYTYYRIEVKAEGGNASAVTFAYTLEGTPGPLGSFRIPDVGASSVLLEWESPRFPNGRIAYSYRITETATGSTTDVDLRPDELGVPDGRFFRWRVADLTGYTEYQLSMRAFNILYNHQGPTSDLLVIRTNQGKPGPPDAVRVDATRRASLLVSWSPPKKPNGIITEYEITTQWANATGTPKTFTVIHQNNPTARFQEIGGLEYPAQYSVIIRAKTISGEGAGSKPILMFTKFVDPDDRTPHNVTHWDLTSTSVYLNWERPLHPNLLNYTLTVRIDGSIPFIRRVINANETSESVEGLMPYTLFSATLFAGYADGSLGDVSDPQYFQTPPSAPSSAPRNFTVGQTNESSTLLLSWISPLESDLNGVLCGFVARYWPINSPDKESTTDFDAGDHEVLLTELTPYTMYRVEIAAETCSVDGQGPFASGRNRTGEGVPNKPNIDMVSRNSTWMKLRWTVEPNGILFRVEANISSDQGHVYNTSNVTGTAEFYGLKPYHHYTVRIRAHSGRGAGAFGTRNVSTCAGAPLSAAVIHTCEALQGGDQDKEVKAIRLNYTDISMQDWRGERQGYRVHLFKGNETGTGQVFSDTKYVGQSVGGSNTLEVDESTIAFDQWYTVTMEAESLADCGQTTVGPSSDPCRFLIPTPNNPPGANTNDGTDMTMIIAIAVSVAVLVLIVLVIVVICVRRRRRQAELEIMEMEDLRKRRSLFDVHGGAHWLMTWPTYDEFQFSKERLKIEDELGEGQFGKVYSAWATGIVKGEDKTRVAVKTMKRGSSQETAEDFRKEMEIMMDFDHPNIVRLLGICTHDEPLYLITELMKHGDLKDYIRKARPNEMHPRPLLSIAQMVDIAAQAASGVAYLASRKFVHRDIAARNCLVGENDKQLSVKISDFGMARDVYQEEYYRRRGGTLPIRWMAPEAITDGKYTVESDVWSLGVLLWEIFSFGYQPYFGRDNEQVIGGILQGSLILECPPLCPRSVFQLMLRCWERNPSERIQSGDVANALQDMRDLCDDGSEGVYDLALDQRYVSRKKVAAEPSKASPSYLNMTPTPQSKPPPVQEDYLPMSPVTPSGTKLDPMFEEEALLPQSKDSYLDMSGGDVPFASSGQKRNTYVEIPQKEPEGGKKKKKLSSQGPAYANVSTEDLDSPKAAGETGDAGATESGDQLSYENPSYSGIPTSGPVTGKKNPSGEKAVENPSYTGVSSEPTTYL